MFIDKTTEAIAHFIGLFDVTAEAARLRKSYNEFTAKQHHERDPSTPDSHPVSLTASLDLNDFDPGVLYLSQPSELVRVVHDTTVTFRPVPTKSAHITNHEFDPTRPLHAAPVLRSGHGQLEPQGSIGTYIHQEAVLSDDDFVSVGLHGLSFRSVGDPDAQLAHLVDAAHDLSPLWGLDTAGVTGSTAALAGFVENVALMLRDFATHHDNVDADGLSLFVSSDPLGQSFVNGVAVTGDLPVLDDYLKTKPDDAADAQALPSSIRLGGDTPSTGASAIGSTAHGLGAYSDQSFVELSSGGNTLVNTAQIANQWTAAHVMAAVGDYHQLDAITQVNVYADQDAIGTMLNSWQLGESDPTQAFNIAMFKQTDLGPQHTANLPAPGQFPAQWAVTTLQGDLTILAWVEQLSFMSDNDLAVLSSSGVRATVTTGDNMQLNDLFLQQIGHFYDLIIVGGNIYDANIIQQINVLLDDDLVGGVNGFQTNGQFQLSTQGNLLWNQATIHNMHGAGVVEGLPNAYQQAAANFAAGHDSLPAGVMNDPMFAGLAGLRVLYVTGDFLNLQYIKQTNILGDSDQVALAMDQVKPDANAHWTVTTGNNQVINLAGITDVDYSGKIYAGGHTYSDAMLVQAELVSSKPTFGLQNPDHLVNEAVAFLQDSNTHPSADHWNDSFAQPTVADHHGAVDPMHGMLS